MSPVTIAAIALWGGFVFFIEIMYLHKKGRIFNYSYITDIWYLLKYLVHCEIQQQHDFNKQCGYFI